MAELREPTTRARLAAAALFSSSSTSRAVVGRRDLKHHTTRVPLPFPLPLPSPTYRLECYVVDTDSFALYLEVRSPPLLASLSSFRPPRPPPPSSSNGATSCCWLWKIRPFSMLNERFRAHNVLIFH